jgi:hypothetical protein
MPPKTLIVLAAGWGLAAECSCYDLGIIIQRTNDWMLLEKSKGFLLGCLSLEKLTNRSQVKRSVRESDSAGFFQGIAGVSTAQAH